MFRRLPLALAFCWFLTGCGSEPATPASPVRLHFPPGGAPLNEHFGFDVETDGRTLLDVDADMPAHKHGILTDPVVERLPNGRWRVEGMLLHMPGDWELYFDLADADGRTERVVIPLVLDHS